MKELEEIKEQAQELLDFGNSHDKAEGRGMMKVIQEIENNFNPSWRSVLWSTEDFKGRAEEIWLTYTFKKRIEWKLPCYPDAKKWQDVFDETKFEDALEKMIGQHDACYGINWESVIFYLDSMCLNNIS